MVIKVVSDDGISNPIDVAKGIRFAVDNGANIINISLGAKVSSLELEESIKYAKTNGVYIIAATGDMNEDDSLYPARYDSVITIAAQDKRGYRYAYSNKAKGVDILIPGVDIDVAMFDYEQEQWYKTNVSGSSIASMIFTGLLSALNLSRSYIDWDYMNNIKEGDFMDYGKMKKEGGVFLSSD